MEESEGKDNPRKIIQTVLIISVFFIGIMSGAVLFKLGFTGWRAVYIFVLLVLCLLSLRSPYIALFFFFLTIPLNYIGAITEWKTILRVQHIFVFFSILATTYYLFISGKKEEIRKRIATPIDIPLFLFGAIIVLSILQTVYVPDNPPINLNRIHNYPWIESILKAGILAVYVCLFYCVQALLSTKEEIKKWLTRYMTIASVVSIYGILAFLVFLGSGYYISIDGYPAVVDLDNDLPRIKATEHEPSFFGFYLMTIIPVFLAVAVRQIREKTIFYKNQVILFFLGTTLLALFLSGSRSAILAFIFSAGTLFFLNKDGQQFYQYARSYVEYILLIINRMKQQAKQTVARIIASKLAIAFVLLFLITIGFFITMNWTVVASKSAQIIEEGILGPTIGTFSDAYGKFWSTKTRLMTAGYALDAFQQHPWLGVGYENYGFYTGNKLYLGLLEFNITWPEVNNYPLRVLAEQGIIGFIAFLFFVAVFFYSLFLARKKATDPFLKAVVEGYIATFVGIAVLLLFTSNIIKPYIWVTLALAVAAVKVIDSVHDRASVQ